MFISIAWAQQGYADCPEDQLRVIATAQAIESGMDAKSLYEAGYALCKAKNTTDAGIKMMWTAYGDYHTKFAQLKKELSLFPMDRMEMLEKEGGRIPADLIAPMRRLGASAMMTMVASSSFYKAAIDVNSARLMACVNDDITRCLEEAQTTISTVKRAISNIEVMEPYLLSFSLLSVVDEDWTCCINMSGDMTK
ncbi:MAG: hypothetical protein EOM19_03680 [Candidatus Moranbacteria bacterium]|nr:hypothetical protein [Candidatus Moranbacteria bacterium]